MKKLELAKQVLDSDNELRTLSGKSAESFNGKEVETYARKFTTSQLEAYISRNSELISRKRKEIALLKWYSTPEGADYKKSLDEEKDLLKKEIKDATEKISTWVNDEVKNILGAEWRMVFSQSSIEIGLIDKENPNAMFLFGHSFTISFGEYYGEGFRFQANIGTMGSFNLDPDCAYLSFIHGAGTFLCNDFLIKQIRNKLFEYSKDIIDTEREIDGVDEMLSNPKAMLFNYRDC